MHRPRQLATTLACSMLLLAGCGGQATEALTAEVPPVVQPAGDGALAAAEGHTDGAAPVLGPTCSSPMGYSVDRPEGWSVNPGTQLPACSWFHSEPFTVPEGTDVRTAITIRVEDGQAATARPDERSRSTVLIDGRTAHRIEQVTTAGLYPVGTPITTYAVDLGDGRVLLADAVGLAVVEHERNVEVLDAMMRSLEFPGGSTV